MIELKAAIFNLVQHQHPAKISALCKKIKLIDAANANTLEGFFSSDSGNNLLSLVITEWQRVKCSSNELAGLIAGVSYGIAGERKLERLELVWTGPDTGIIPVRRSEQVLLDVIASAKDSLTIVSFVVNNVPNVEKELRAAILRGVSVRILIETEDKDNTESFRATAESLSNSVPGMELYIWPREKRFNASVFARVHAKCAVADDSVAFITSANLTSAALERNIETGVLVKGGRLPVDFCKQFDAMKDTGEIVLFTKPPIKGKSKSGESIPISLEELPSRLASSSSARVSVLKTDGSTEVRVFEAFSSTQMELKKNSLVVLNLNGELLVGKLRWQKQQDLENPENKFFLVSLRGYGAPVEFQTTESEWDSFAPLAIERVK